MDKTKVGGGIIAKQQERMKEIMEK